MSLHETRDECGHSEIVLAKKCRTCKAIAQNRVIDAARKCVWADPNLDVHVDSHKELDEALDALDALAKHAAESKNETY